MSTFRMSVEGKPDCLVLLYYTLRDLLRDSALPSEPITCKKATNRDLLTLFDLFKTSHDLLRLLFMGVARIFEGGGGVEVSHCVGTHQFSPLHHCRLLA